MTIMIYRALTTAARVARVVCTVFVRVLKAGLALIVLQVSSTRSTIKTPAIHSSVEENGEIATFHTFLTHLTAHLVLNVRRTTDVRVPLDVFISSRGRPSESQWSVRARMEADEDLVELVVKNGRNGEWFCGISFTSNVNSTRVVGFSIVIRN
jgi:hypothetical protein